MNRLTCECGRTLGFEARHAGKKVRCPGCQSVLVVPDDEEIADVIAVEDDPPPRGKKSTSRRQDIQAEEEPVRPRRSRRDEEPEEVEEDRPRRSRRDEDAEEEEPEPERPRRKRRKARPVANTGFFSSFSGLLDSGITIRILCVVGAVGIGLLVYGFTEWRVSSGATQTPQTLTCQQLIDGGVPSNPHVLVTDVLPGDNYVYSIKVTQAEKNSGNTNGKPWDSVYVPLLPLTPALKTMLARGEQFVPKPPGNQVRVIMLSRKAKNANDLGPVFAQGRVQGLIVNSVSSLDSETQTLLRQSYPGADLGRVLILEEGRKPSSKVFAFSILGLGLVLFLGCGGPLLLALIGRAKG